jgi:hypothetical protein
LLTSKHPSYIINNMNLPSCPMCQSENYSDSKPLNAIYILHSCHNVNISQWPLHKFKLSLYQTTKVHRTYHLMGICIEWKTTMVNVSTGDAVKDCPATINTRNNMPTGFGRRPHNHPSNQAKIYAKQIINTMRNRAKSEAEPLP